MSSATSPARQAREPHDPVRVRLLKAALELFSDHGYRATTTKQISSRAGVSEPTLFRHFGSKAELFEAAFLEPFSSFVNDWTRSWYGFPDGSSVEDMAERLVAGLFTLARRERRMLHDLIGARSDPDSDLHATAVAVSVQLRAGLKVVHDAGLDIAGQRGLYLPDPTATMGAVTAMIIGSALLEEWIYPAGARIPSRNRIIRETTALLVHGLAHHPGSGQ